MNNNSWFCKVCGHMNVSSSIACALCKRQKEESFISKVRTTQKNDSEMMMERVSQTGIEFQGLQTRLEAARKKLEEENSLPPTGAIRLIVPNNWMGIAITAIVVIAIVTLIVLVKSFAK